MKLYCPKCDKVFKVDQSTGSVPCPVCAKEIKCPEKFPGPGAVIGDFLIEKPISSGGMGEVFVARQISLDRPVALKVLQGEYTGDKEYIDGLFREARAAAKINHPNIVQAYAVGEDDGVFFFAMELVRGDTLKAVLKREGVLAFDKAARIICDIAKALDTAWKEQKLVHQDIKPDNIMWDNSRKLAKLADLGIAKTAATEVVDDDADEVLGTPQYISPEQLTGVPTDVRSDIYSLGATFFHFVTGRFPYVAPTAEELAHMHNAGNLEPPQKFNPQLPDELNRIILKMMARQLTDRYQSAVELSDDLEKFLLNYKANGKKVKGVPKLSVPRTAPPASGPAGKKADENSGRKITIPPAVWKIAAWSGASLVVLALIAAGTLYVFGKTGNIALLPEPVQMVAEKVYGKFPEKTPEPEVKPVVAEATAPVSVVPEKAAVVEPVAAVVPKIRKEYQDAAGKITGEVFDLPGFDAVWQILSTPQNEEEAALFREKNAGFAVADEVRCGDAREALRSKFLQAKENEKMRLKNLREEQERIQKKNALRQQEIEKQRKEDELRRNEYLNAIKKQVAEHVRNCVEKISAAGLEPAKEKDFNNAVQQARLYVDTLFGVSAEETEIKTQMLELLDAMPAELVKLRKEFAKISEVNSSHYIVFRDAKRKSWEVMSIKPGVLFCRDNSGNTMQINMNTIDPKAKKSLLRNLKRGARINAPEFYLDMFNQQIPGVSAAPQGFWKKFMSFL